MNISETLAPRFDWDLVDGRVAIHGRTIALEQLSPVLQESVAGEGSEFALLELKKGDQFPIDIGTTYDGAPVAPEPTSLKFGLKEFDTSRLISLSDGTSLKIVRDGGTRFRIFASFEAVAMQRILAKYTDLSGTYVDVLCELEGTWDYVEPHFPDSYSAGALLNLGAVVDTPVILPLGVEQAEDSVDYELSVRVSLADINPSFFLRAFRFQSGTRTVDVTLVKSGAGFEGVTIGAPVPGIDPTGREDVAMLPAKLSVANVLGISESGELNLNVSTAAFTNPEFTYPVGNIWIARLHFTTYFTSAGHQNVSWGTTDIYEGTAVATGASRTLSFIDGAASPVGSLTIGMTYSGLDLASPHVVDGKDVYVLGSRTGNERELEIIWLEDPGVVTVSTPGIAPAPVMVESAPQAQRFSVEATLTRKEPLSDPIERRVIKSSQTFIARLRRDLIPQEAPAEEPEGSE